jgi:hypothetical protein
MIGQASVIDGDTLEIHGTRIRLWGTDAPESSRLGRNDDSVLYRCGAKSANELDAFIARRTVTCTPVSLGRVLINAGAGGNVPSWGEAEGADGQTPLDSVENDPDAGPAISRRAW